MRIYFEYSSEGRRMPATLTCPDGVNKHLILRHLSNGEASGISIIM